MSGDWFQVSFDQYLCKCTLYVYISVGWLEAVPILVYVVTLLLTLFPLKQWCMLYSCLPIYPLCIAQGTGDVQGQRHSLAA